MSNEPSNEPRAWGAGLSCICEPPLCAGEGYERDDPRTCQHCAALDGEMPCPADEEYAAEVVAEAESALAGE